MTSAGRKEQLSPMVWMVCGLVISVCVVAAVFGLGAQKSDQIDQTAVVTAQGAGSAVPAVNLADTLISHSISVGGLDRQFYVYQPQGLDPAKPAPLILAFHGGGGNAADFAEKTKLLEVAEKYGFVIALPQGIRGSWNSGGHAPIGYSERNHIDDIGFVSAMLDAVALAYSIDPKRTFATGMSSGAMMTYRVACDLPKRVSAIAVVAGTLNETVCNGAQDVSLLHIHGTDDQNVPIDGGAGAMSARSADYPAVQVGVSLFKTHNHCDAIPQRTRPAQDTACDTATCSDNEIVEFCSINGGGHAWPGTSPALWQRLAQVYVSPYFDATDYIAQFFLNQ